MVSAMTRILLISGDIRGDSLHTAALRTAARFAPAGITATLYGGLRGLPAFVPGERIQPDPVTLLRHRVDHADAILFSTPQYAGSLPGTLKNLIDWLADTDRLEDKPVAWVSIATTPDEDDGARRTLETVLGYVRARVLRQACVRIPVPPRAIDEQGLVTDERLRTALTDVLTGLARTAAVPEPREVPAWQAYSSVFPVVQRREPSPFRNGFPPG
jgi:chromate reductase